MYPQRIRHPEPIRRSVGAQNRGYPVTDSETQISDMDRPRPFPFVFSAQKENGGPDMTPDESGGQNKRGALSK